MKRRWIIRSFFIGLLLLCVGAWILSGVRWQYVDYSSKHPPTDNHNYFVTLFSGEGVIVFRYISDISVPKTFTGWQFESSPATKVRFFPRDDSAFNYYLGFAIRPKGVGVGWAVPYWFLIVISAVLLWLVWRKTRPKPHPKTAFPVELSSASSGQTGNTE